LRVRQAQDLLPRVEIDPPEQACLTSSEASQGRQPQTQRDGRQHCLGGFELPKGGPDARELLVGQESISWFLLEARDASAGVVYDQPVLDRKAACALQVCERTVCRH